MSFQRVINLTFPACSGLVAAFFAFTYLVSRTQPSIAAPTQPSAITGITRDPGSALCPALSPDECLIAFESNRDGTSHIYVMNADDTNQRALKPGAMSDHQPIWTPDGKSILFDSSDGITQNIFTITTAEGVRIQLTAVDGLADYAATSPDGQRNAFYVYKDLTLNLWTARADGTDAKPLTRNFLDAWRREPTVAWHQPTWRLDIQFLASTGVDAKSIWLIREDGSDSKNNYWRR